MSEQHSWAGDKVIDGDVLVKKSLGELRIWRRVRWIELPDQEEISEEMERETTSQLLALAAKSINHRPLYRDIHNWQNFRPENYRMSIYFNPQTVILNGCLFCGYIDIEEQETVSYQLINRPQSHNCECKTWYRNDSVIKTAVIGLTRREYILAIKEEKGFTVYCTFWQLD